MLIKGQWDILVYRILEIRENGMGDIIEITCKKCFHIWQYPIGCGMLHGRLDYVSELFSKEIQTQINELVREKRFPTP